MSIEACEGVQQAGRVPGLKPATLKPITVSIPEFCALVGCGRSLAFQLLRNREVVGVKLGRRTVITMASIEALIERNSRPGPTP